MIEILATVSDPSTRTLNVGWKRPPIGASIPNHSLLILSQNNTSFQFSPTFCQEYVYMLAKLKLEN